ncbi:type II secretion system F family protein [Cohnella thailandensis]|uniref:Type II secretion system F family protein n=1 Tax=Cohnella thailandensis TaxID=557557 RepID=A0A841SQS2_9BACL|nr:type II secretion system F family protein [Cohnella thailandensis]MBB6633542.1 type II secretion system F family protein [Cohnella thailandensis]MBP1974559.1 tight adherence protein B [Cohnella thailandensis]
MTDYSEYPLTRSQRVMAVLVAAAIFGIVIWLMYRHAVIALMASPLGLLGPRLLRSRLKRQRQERLRLQFKSMLQALASLLAAGRSVENAFDALEGDMVLLLGDPNADIIREIRAVRIRAKSGDPLEAPLTDFAARSGLEEARSFAEVFSICKRSGGDLVEVVRRSSAMIGEKMEVEQELGVLIAQKRLESSLMMGMPFAFVGLLGFFAGDYMEGLHQGAGWLVLTGCLLLLGGCCWWMYRIMEIRI